MAEMVDSYSTRIRVPEGWLVTTRVGFHCFNQLYVPDPDHLWIIPGGGVVTEQIYHNTNRIDLPEGWIVTTWIYDASVHQFYVPDPSHS